MALSQFSSHVYAGPKPQSLVQEELCLSKQNTMWPASTSEIGLTASNMSISLQEPYRDLIGGSVIYFHAQKQLDLIHCKQRNEPISQAENHVAFNSALMGLQSTNGIVKH